MSRVFFFFNDTATTEIYTLSLHDALPIFPLLDATGPRLANLGRSPGRVRGPGGSAHLRRPVRLLPLHPPGPPGQGGRQRSEEHTSELQSRQYLVCRLLLEKKKKHKATTCE